MALFRGQPRRVDNFTSQKLFGLSIAICLPDSHPTKPSLINRPPSSDKNAEISLTHFALSYLLTTTIPTYAAQHNINVPLRNLCSPTKWK